MSATEKPIRVLLIEPNTFLLEGIATLLRAEPDMHLVGSATSTLAGVDLARLVHPSVILFDLDLDGAASALTVQQLREANASASIIALTSYELDPVATSVIQVGASAVIAKHQLGSSLLDLIRRARVGRTNA